MGNGSEPTYIIYSGSIKYLNDNKKKKKNNITDRCYYNHILLAVVYTSIYYMFNITYSVYTPIDSLDTYNKPIYLH